MIILLVFILVLKKKCNLITFFWLLFFVCGADSRLAGFIYFKRPWLDASHFQTLNKVIKDNG